MTENQRRPAPRRRRRVHKTRLVGCFVVLLLIIILISSLISGCVKKIKDKPAKQSSGTSVSDPAVTDQPDIHHETGNIVVCLDPGHGDSDPGSEYGARLEKDDDLRYAREVYEAMKQYEGIDVYLTRDSDIYLSNEDRAEFSNSVNADLHVALHRNYFSDSTAYGLEVWVKSAPDQIDDVFSFKVISKLSSVGIQKNRGVKTGHPKNDDYEIVKMTNANCITIELGYITNDKDNELFDQHLTEYAAAIAEAISETCYEQIKPAKEKKLNGE